MILFYIKKNEKSFCNFIIIFFNKCQKEKKENEENNKNEKNTEEEYLENNNRRNRWFYTNFYRNRIYFRIKWWKYERNNNK